MQTDILFHAKPIFENRINFGFHHKKLPNMSKLNSKIPFPYVKYKFSTFNSWFNDFKS